VEAAGQVRRRNVSVHASEVWEYEADRSSGKTNGNETRIGK
jgi:hypothetical protein